MGKSTKYRRKSSPKTASAFGQIDQHRRHTMPRFQSVQGSKKEGDPEFNFVTVSVDQRTPFVFRANDLSSGESLEPDKTVTF